MTDMTMRDAPAGVVTIKSKESKKAQSVWRVAFRRFLKHRMAVFGVIMLFLLVLYCVAGTLFYSEAYADEVALVDKYQPPNANHLFGTDSVGRDLMARTIYGGQISLMIGFFSVTISITVGTLVGIISAYFGGWVDSVLMRFTEALLSIPALILLLLFSRMLRDNTDTIVIFGRQLSASVIAIVLIIGLLGWMNLARIVRAVALSLKEQEFVLAATTIGATSWRIIFMHILPNCIAPIIVAATLGIGTAIITEAYLSFLGFGVMAPTATWGNILNSAQNQLQQYPWMWVFPSAFIIITVLAINFIGDGLRDAFDPRSTR